MASLKKLTICQFRGIRNFTLDNIPKVVLFGGRNNSGKTTILEAVMALLSRQSAGILLEENHYRLLGSKTIDDVRNAFMEDPEGVLANVEGESDTGVRLKAEFKIQLQPNPVVSVSDSLEKRNSLMAYEIVGTFSYWDEKGVLEKNDLHAIPSNGDEGTWQIQQVPLKPFAPVAFLPTTVVGNVALYPLGVVFKLGEKDRLIGALRRIDPLICDINLDKENILVNVKGRKKPLPLQTFGSGMSQIVRFVSALIATPHGIFAIDEIGNGLHYSSCKVLWDVLLPIVKENDNQIFVTTHRKDVLQAFTDSYAEQENAPSAEYINLIRDLETSERKAYRYSTEKLKNALEAELEVR